MRCSRERLNKHYLVLMNVIDDINVLYKKMINDAYLVTNKGIYEYYQLKSIEMNYNSNSIEGSTITLEDADVILTKSLGVNKSLKDINSTLNYNEAYFYVINMIKNQDYIITEDKVFEVNRLVQGLTKHENGYRSFNDRIVGSKVRTADRLNISDLMEKFIDSVNDSITKANEFNTNPHKTQNDWFNVVTRLAQHHGDFEAIHPFIDGNGRTGRLLVMLEAAAYGIPPVDIKKKNQKDYYNSLEYYQTNYDNEEAIYPLASLFADNIRLSLKDFIEAFSSVDNFRKKVNFTE